MEVTQEKGHRAERGSVTTKRTSISKLLTDRENQILADWTREQMAARTLRLDLIDESELRQQSTDFLCRFREALQSSDSDIQAPEWKPSLDLLANISRSRTVQGFSPSETATFVFSLKQPLFGILQQTLGHEPERLVAELWKLNILLDKLGLFTTEIYQKTREEVIRRQQDELLELSTPVVKLWDGILALPMIGTLDSARTQTVMESLLQKILETGSEVAIIDITGVPNVDTLVAQHLLKTVTAARLMGADCIISGIRPQIAQTIVHLGVDLGDIITKANLADAFLVALRRTGRSVGRTLDRNPDPTAVQV